MLLFAPNEARGSNASLSLVNPSLDSQFLDVDGAFSIPYTAGSTLIGFASFWFRAFTSDSFTVSPIERSLSPGSSTVPKLPTALANISKDFL